MFSKFRKSGVDLTEELDRRGSSKNLSEDVQNTFTADLVERKLNVSRVSADDAKRGIPSSKDVNLTPKEIEIVSFCSSVAQNAIKKYEQHWQKLLKQAPRIPIEGQVLEEIKELLFNGRQEIRNVKSKYAPEISILSESEKRARQDLSHFRTTEGIIHEANYDDNKKYRFWFAMLVLLAIEAAINGLTIGTALSGGAISGIIIALVLSVGVVSLGFASGLAFRAKNLNGHLFRKVGWVLTGILGFAGVLFLALYAAHYRALIQEQNSSEAVGFAISSIASRIFSTSDVFAFINVPESFFLFLTAVAIGAFSVSKGYNFHTKDHYPGYARKHRFHKERIEKLELKKKEMMKEIHSFYEVAQIRINTASDKFHKNTQSLKTISSRANELKLYSENVILVAEKVCSGVLAKYRTVNIQVRGEDYIKPPYWKNSVKLVADGYVRPIVITSIDEELDKIVNMQDDFFELCRTAKDNLRTEVETEVTKTEEIIDKIESIELNDNVAENLAERK